MMIDKIRKIIGDEHISVFGIAPATTMADESIHCRPESFFPGVKSLICFGIPLPSAVYKAFVYPSETIWRSKNLLYRRLDTLALRISALLEENGAPGRYPYKVVCRLPWITRAE